MKKMYTPILLLLSAVATAAVTLPYTFAPNSTIKSSELNADLGTLRDAQNAHTAASNPHQTKLKDVLGLGNSAGTYAIDMNGNQILNVAAENLASDPAPALKGRIFYNTVTNLLKLDTGSSIATIGGTNANNLSSVLNSGNSAGSNNLDMNLNQLLRARVENLSADPSPGSSGRIWYNTVAGAVKLDTGSSIATVGGAQGLSSVLGISNSAGVMDIDFNGNQAKNMVLDKQASDPAGAAGKIYYNTGTKVPRFHNGTSWSNVGNTNSLAQTLAIGNTTGTSDIDFNFHEAKNMKTFNNLGSPGTGSAGLMWYDTGTSKLNFETSTLNHALVSEDQTQTLTNKTISGASNTLSNIPDSALSANIDKLNSAQSVSGKKTFSTNPVVTALESTSGATMTLPSGIASDTIALVNASQTLVGKTLTGPSFTGDSNFNMGEALNFRVENLSADPSPGNAGRLYYKTTTGEMKYDTGIGGSVITLARGNQDLDQVLTAGNSAGAHNIDMNGNQLINARLENLAVLPAPGHKGRMAFNLMDSQFYYDDGSAWVPTTGIAGVTPPITLTSGVIGIDQSTTATDGYLSSTDWNTFNGKEPAITATTSADYYRGDKTFQPLNEDAVKLVNIIGTPEHQNLTMHLDSIMSASAVERSNITDNGNGTVNISSGDAHIRSSIAITSITRSGGTATVTTASPHNLETGYKAMIRGANEQDYDGIFYVTVTGPSTFTYTVLNSPATPATGSIFVSSQNYPIYNVSINAQSNLSMTDHKTNYVFIDYSGGVPDYGVTTNPNEIFGLARVTIWVVAREGNTLWINDARGAGIDTANKTETRNVEVDRFRHVQGGSVLSEKTGRKFALSGGAFWYGLNKTTHAAFDTSASDTFTIAYTPDSGTSWTYSTGQSVNGNTQYNNVGSGLASLTVGNYGVYWVYVMNNSPSTLMVLYGQGDYTKSQAFASQEPTIKPDIVSGLGVLVGRIIVKQGASVFTNVTSKFIDEFVNPAPDLDSLADVSVPSPTLGDSLIWNGSTWVNAPATTVSAGAGVNFYNATPAVHATGTNNDNFVATLSRTPVTTAEQTTVSSLASNTLLNAAWKYGSALNRTSIDAGTWSFTSFAGVNSVAGGRVTTITRNVYQTVPGSTVTTTGSGTTRTATAASGTPFVSGDASATITVGGYLETPQGLYKISAFTSSTVVTIITPSTYVNESAVAFTTWKNLFGSTSPAITSITPNYTATTYYSTQPEFTIATTDSIGFITFGTSNNTTTLTTAYNGNTHNSFVNTPLVVLHNDLASIQGGNSTERYHLTAAQATVATQAATGSVNGYLTSTDWTTFNGKLATNGNGSSLTGITATQIGLGNVTNDAQIKASIGTTKGDLIGFSASGTPGNLAIGSASQILTVDSSQTYGFKWADNPALVTGPTDLKNIKMAVTVGSNNLTVAVKVPNGSDPSASSPVTYGLVGQVTQGTYTTASITSALSLTVTSGTTLGLAAATSTPIYMYLFDSSGTGAAPKIAVSTVKYSGQVLYDVVAESEDVSISIASPAVVTLANYKYKSGDPITFSTSGALPTGLTAGTTYYVKAIDSTTFNLSATSGGANINTTGSQSGTHKIRPAGGSLVSDAKYASVVLHYVGMMKISEATPGTWASAPDTVWLPVDSGTPAFRTETLYVTNSGTPTIARKSSGWVTSLTDDGVGLTSINVLPGVCSDRPTCTVSSSDGGDTASVRNAWIRGTITSTRVGVGTLAAASLVDAPFDLICTCPW